MEHIIGDIADSATFEALHEGFDRAFEFLRRPDLATLPLGDYVLDPTPDEQGRPRVKAMVQEATLKPVPASGVLHAEAHGDFIDIQAPLSGSETFGLATFVADDPDYVFDSDHDVGFKDVRCDLVTLRPGQFAIFFPPCGAHAPCHRQDNAERIKKVVIKIRA